jgi:transcriptional regulator with XRE-family HTH domain
VHLCYRVGKLPCVEEGAEGRREAAGSGASRDQGASFGVRLRRLRQAAGFSQEKLAARAGLTAKAVSLLERGKRKHPYPHTVRSLAEALGLSESERVSLSAASSRRGGTSPGGETATPVFTLPVLPTPLVGRDREVGEIDRLLGEEAVRLVTLKQCLAKDQRLGDKSRMAYSLGDLADVHCSTGDLENGADYYKRSLALHRDLDDRRSIALTLHNLGEIALKQGDPMKAEDLFEGSLRMAREIDDRWLIINMLPGMGSLLGLLGHGERAVGVLAAADALRREIGFEFQSHSLADYERAVEQARKALPAERFEAVWQGGCAMSLEEVARYVLRGDAVP